MMSGRNTIAVLFGVIFILLVVGFVYSARLTDRIDAAARAETQHAAPHFVGAGLKPAPTTPRLG